MHLADISGKKKDSNHIRKELKLNNYLKLKKAHYKIATNYKWI
jgi:hypothetical protein